MRRSWFLEVDHTQALRAECHFLIPHHLPPLGHELGQPDGETTVKLEAYNFVGDGSGVNKVEWFAGEGVVEGTS